jgi:hypothetical protein
VRKAMVFVYPHPPTLQHLNPIPSTPR